MAGQIKQTRVFTSISSADMPFTLGDELITEDCVLTWNGTDWVPAITEERIREIVGEELGKREVKPQSIRKQR